MEARRGPDRSPPGPTSCGSSSCYFVPTRFHTRPPSHLVLSSPSTSQCVILKLSSLPRSHQPLLPQEELTTPLPGSPATLRDPLNTSYHSETEPPIYVPVRTPQAYRPGLVPPNVPPASHSAASATWSAFSEHWWKECETSTYTHDSRVTWKIMGSSIPMLNCFLRLHVSTVPSGQSLDFEIILSQRREKKGCQKC